MLSGSKTSQTRIVAGLCIVALSGCAAYVPVTFEGPDYPSGTTRPAQLIKRDSSETLKIQSAKLDQDTEGLAVCQLIVMPDGEFISTHCIAQGDTSPQTASYIGGLSDRLFYRSRAIPALSNGAPIGVTMSAVLHFVQKGDERSLRVYPHDRWQDELRTDDFIAAQKKFGVVNPDQRAPDSCRQSDRFRVSGRVSAAGALSDLTLEDNGADAACIEFARAKLSALAFIPAFNGQGKPVTSRFDEAFAWPRTLADVPIYLRRDPNVKESLRPEPRIVWPVR